MKYWFQIKIQNIKRKQKNKDKKKKLQEKYKISKKELPRMLKTDAAITSLNSKPGDVIKIIRKSQSAGEAIFYRVVVDV